MKDKVMGCSKEEWAKASEIYRMPYSGEVGKMESYEIPFNSLAGNLPNRYITNKMVEILSKSLRFGRYTNESIKANNLWWLQKKMRKGSWAAKCVEWDACYREVMLRRVDPLSERRHLQGGTIRVKRVLDTQWLKQFER